MKIKSIITNALLFSTALSMASDEPFDFKNTKQMIITKATEFFTSLAEPKDVTNNQIPIDFKKLDNYIKEKELYLPTNQYAPRDDKATKRRMLFTDLLQEAFNATKNLANTEKHIIFFDNEAWSSEAYAENMIIIKYNGESFPLKDQLHKYFNTVKREFNPYYANVQAISNRAAKDDDKLRGIVAEHTKKEKKVLFLIDTNIPQTQMKTTLFIDTNTLLESNTKVKSFDATIKSPTKLDEIILSIKAFLHKLFIAPFGVLIEYAFDAGQRMIITILSILSILNPRS